MVAQPFLKWAGSKRYLLPEILPRLPAKINTYYEPFIGGGALFFALAALERFKNAILSDTNDELIRTYLGVANYLGGVISRLLELKYDETEYYKIRALDPTHLEPADLAARFIYLNRTGFNGLYRVNKAGKFNVPFGRYTNPTICDEGNLRAVAAVLRRYLITACDFEHVVQTAKQGDAVYFDPPYVPVSATSNFTAYGKDGFGPNEQTCLRDVAKRLIGRDVHVLLSNSDTPFVRELYKDFKIEEVRVPRRINSKGGKRGDVGELLISGR
jgi:DNA adenine methylase